MSDQPEGTPTPEEAKPTLKVLNLKLKPTTETTEAPVPAPTAGTPPAASEAAQPAAPKFTLNKPTPVAPAPAPAAPAPANHAKDGTEGMKRSGMTFTLKRSDPPPAPTPAPAAPAAPAPAAPAPAPAAPAPEEPKPKFSIKSTGPEVSPAAAMASPKPASSSSDKPAAPPPPPAMKVKQVEPRFTPATPQLPIEPVEEEPSMIAYSISIVAGLALIGIVFAVVKFGITI